MPFEGSSIFWSTVYVYHYLAITYRGQLLPLFFIDEGSSAVHVGRCLAPSVLWCTVVAMSQLFAPLDIPPFATFATLADWMPAAHLPPQKSFFGLVHNVYIYGFNTFLHSFYAT